VTATVVEDLDEKRPFPWRAQASCYLLPRQWFQNQLQKIVVDEMALEKWELAATNENLAKKMRDWIESKGEPKDDYEPVGNRLLSAVGEGSDGMSRASSVVRQPAKGLMETEPGGEVEAIEVGGLEAADTESSDVV
jgi:hypothetical protein